MRVCTRFVSPVVWLVAGGVILTSIVAGAIFLSSPAADLAAPYSYASGASGASEASEAAAELALLIPGARAEHVELLVAERDAPIVTAQVLRLPGQGEVIVGWQNEVAEPVLRSDTSSAEELALVTALRKHLPEDSTVLAMPALSARLKYFVRARFPLAPEREALRIPARWEGRNSAVAQLETRWQSNEAAALDNNEAATLDNDAVDKSGFSEFANALLAGQVDGAARLQALASSGQSYVILHVRDVFDLGVAVPDSVLVGMRDFPAGAQIHDISRAVKDWAREKNHAAYAVQRQNGGAVRAYYLTDTSDKNTLVAQLLPFNTARIGLVSGTRLVFQTSGYWIYRLHPSVGES